MSSIRFAVHSALTAMGTIAGSWINGEHIQVCLPDNRLLGDALIASLQISLALVVESQLASTPLYAHRSGGAGQPVHWHCRAQRDPRSAGGSLNDCWGRYCSATRYANA